MLPIVVLSLVAMMGMLVLVVDLGGLLYMRRELVNGADAAALAAAQSCARTDDAEDPEDMADRYAAANVPEVTTGGTNIDESVGCDLGEGGNLHVRYGKVQPLFFAPVLGTDDETDVEATAWAHWGGAGSADGVIPLVIYSGFLQGPACDVPNVPAGTTCYFWEDNDLSGQGNFGFLDVAEGWDVARGDDCANSGGDQQLGDWIDGTTPVDELNLNHPFATWVCTREGNHSDPQVWHAVRDLIGSDRTFPVIGDSPADNQPYQVPTPKPKYNVIGFASMRIDDVLTVRDTAPLPCELAILATEAKPLDLMAMGGASACLVPSNATFHSIPSGGVTPGNVQWSVTPDGVFTWEGNHRPTRIRFLYTEPDTECGGQPAPNSSAHCLVLSWRGFTFEGRKPGGGSTIGGYMAVSLCGGENCVRP